MNRFGILTVRKDKSPLRHKWKKPLQIVDSFRTQAEVLVAEFAWTNIELQGFPKWYQRYLYHKGIRFLKRMGCNKVGPEEDCADAFSLCFQDRGWNVPILPERMEEFLRSSHELWSDVLIQVKKISQIPTSLLSFLCPRAKSLSLVTNDAMQAQKLAEKICTEYGFYPQIHVKSMNLGEQCLLLDMDAGIICIYGQVIDGMEVGMDFHEYRVDQKFFLEDSSIPPETLEVLWWTTGKKRLTTH